MFKKSNIQKVTVGKLDPNQWMNKLLGEPAFIIGNGPSLSEIDVTDLQNYFTIGINRSFLKLDSTILLWQDASLWYTERAKILRTLAIKYCTPYADPENRFYHFDVVRENFGIPYDLQKLIGTGTSAPLAVQLAMLIGCNPIVLLGCDCRTKNNMTNFYGKNKHHSINTMKQCKNGLSWIKTAIHESKLRTIISCSENDYFEYRSLKDVLSGIDVKVQRSREDYKKILFGK